MERKNNIKMNKLILSCLSIFSLCNAGYTQTYIYDKNLKAPSSLIYETRWIASSNKYSTQNIIDEFESNPLRAEYLFKKTNKLFILQGEIGFIGKYAGFNYIGLNVSENTFFQEYIYVLLPDTHDVATKHKFDKITEYNLGDYVNILSKSYAVDPLENKIFTGYLLHYKDIQNIKKNCLVKIINLPQNTAISFEKDEENPWATKFSEVTNGKSYSKLFSYYEYTNMELTFKDKEGNILKKKTIKTKTNCHSIFDYNKL